MNNKPLTSFWTAEAGHHLWGSFEKSKSWVSSTGHRHDTHPLQGWGEGEPLNNSQSLTCRLATERERWLKMCLKNKYGAPDTCLNVGRQTVNSAANCWSVSNSVSNFIYLRQCQNTKFEQREAAPMTGLHENDGSNTHCFFMLELLRWRSHYSQNSVASKLFTQHPSISIWLLQCL